MREITAEWKKTKARSEEVQRERGEDIEGAVTDGALWGWTTRNRHAHGIQQRPSLPSTAEDWCGANLVASEAALSEGMKLHYGTQQRRPTSG